MTHSTHTARVRQAAILPLSLPPRGLTREQAAEYVGVSVTKFDQMRADGRISPPKRIDGRIVFDLRRLDRDFENLPDSEVCEIISSSPFD